MITHGHSDHARAGHSAVLATHETLDIMGERYGLDFAGAFEDVQDARIGEQAAHTIFNREPIAAMYLQRIVCRSPSDACAKQLGHTEALNLFLETLREEEATDQTLTKLAKTSVNLKAAA